MKVHEEFQKVKDDFDKQLKLVENKMLQTRQSSSTDVKKQSTERRKDNGFETKIKLPAFNRKQSVTTSHKQFEADVIAEEWCDGEKLLLSFWLYVGML